MLGPARYLADFARFAATRGAQEHDDAQALAQSLLAIRAG
jgi:hypothetical protein